MHGERRWCGAAGSQPGHQGRTHRAWAFAAQNGRPNRARILHGLDRMDPPVEVSMKKILAIMILSCLFFWAQLSASRVVGANPPGTCGFSPVPA